MIQINIYDLAGNWYAARWFGDDFDGCDPLEVRRGASEATATRAAMRMPLVGVDGKPYSGRRVVRRVNGGAL